MPGVRVQDIAATDVSTYKDFTISVDQAEFGLTRDQLVTVLAVQGIDTRNYFDPPVHRQRAYRASQRACLPVAELTSRSVVSLPIYPDLADRDVELVTTTVRLAHEHAEELAAHDDLVIFR